MSRQTYLPTGMDGVVTCPVVAQPPLLRVDWMKDGEPLDLSLVIKIIISRWRCRHHNTFRSLLCPNSNFCPPVNTTLIYWFLVPDCKHHSVPAAESIHFLLAEKCRCWLQASMKRQPSAAHHAKAFLTISPLSLPTEQPSNNFLAVTVRLR